MNYKKIKSFADACKIEKVDPKKLPVVTGLPVKHRKSIKAFYMLAIIISAINRDENGKPWELDWSNTDQWKYYAWFYVKADKKTPAGSGFSGSYYADSDADTSVGSRLCFRDYERCEYAKKQFEKLYLDYLLM